MAALAAGALGFEVFRLHDRLDESGEADRVSHVSREAPTHRASRGDVEIESPPSSDNRPARPSEPSTPEAPVNNGPEDDVPEEPEERIATLERELDAARETIASLSEPSTEPAGPETASTVLFLGLVTRSAGDDPVLEMGDAAFAEIQVELGHRRSPGEIRATVTRDGVPVWEEDAEVVTLDGESMARILVPRETLGAGDYRITLFRITDGENEEFMTRSFSVTR